MARIANIWEPSLAYVISEYGLDYMKYNDSLFSFYETGIWNKCSLREWLNDWFLEDAFTSSTRRSIQEVTCLSVSEAETLFSSDADRICKQARAFQVGRWRPDFTEECKWWLRDPGSRTSDYAAFVDRDGSISSYGQPVIQLLSTVRPALWLNL